MAAAAEAAPLPVVVGDWLVVLWSLAIMRPFPAVVVVCGVDDAAEALRGCDAGVVVKTAEPPEAITPPVMIEEIEPVQTAPDGQQATWPA